MWSKPRCFESVLGIGLTTRDEIAAKHAIGRTIQPSEIADLVLFLGSDESTAITGQAITIDGRSVMRSQSHRSTAAGLNPA